MVVEVGCGALMELSVIARRRTPGRRTKPSVRRVHKAIQGSSWVLGKQSGCFHCAGSSCARGSFEYQKNLQEKKKA